MNCSICGSRMFTSWCPQCTTRSRPVAYTFQGEVAPRVVFSNQQQIDFWKMAARDLLSKLPRCNLCGSKATRVSIVNQYRCSKHGKGMDEVPWAEAVANMEILFE